MHPTPCEHEEQHRKGESTKPRDLQQQIRRVRTKLPDQVLRLDDTGRGIPGKIVRMIRDETERERDSEAQKHEPYALVQPRVTGGSKYVHSAGSAEARASLLSQKASRAR